MTKRKRLELLGWILFTAGSGIYLIDSIINENPLTAVGSAAFFIACIFFLLSEKY